MHTTKMVPFLSKHTILSGYVDYYCLVCKNRTSSIEDTIKHIITDTHEKELATTFYDSKDDRIKKVKLWYFCEYCGVVLKTKAKVRLHIVETQHVANKTNQFIKRYGNVIIAFDDVLIENEAWDGLCESTCILCTNEYENISEHLKDGLHHINFMQSNIETFNNNIFRMVDETSFHCITCNSQEALPVNTHFESQQHKTVYKKCQVLASKIINHHISDENKDALLKEKDVEKSVDIPLPAKEKTTPLDEHLMQNEKKNVAKSLDETKNSQKSDMRDKENITPAENINSTVQTSAKLNENKSIYNPKKDVDMICKVLGANKYIIKDERGSTWCILCDWVMDSKTLITHLTSQHHTTILTLHELRIKKAEQNITPVEQDKALNAPNFKTIKESIQINPKLNSNQVLKSKKKASSDLTHKTNEENTQHSDALDRFQNNHMNINFEKMTVCCRKCSILVDFDYTSIEKHIGQHTDENDIKADSSMTQLSDNHTKILDLLKIYEKNDIDINSQTNIVTCKKCLATIDFDYSIIEKHIAQHKNNHKEQKAKTGTQLKDILSKINEDKNFASKNSFKLLSDQFVSCEICKTELQCTINGMKEHLHSNTHKTRAEANKVKVDIVAMTTFIQSLVTVKNNIFLDHIINNEFCVNVNSFVFITMKPEVDMNRCLCCDVYLNNDQLNTHVHSKEHLLEINNMKFVNNVKDEFIRQLPANRYHCGFCNVMVNSWQDMTSHLTTLYHRQCKVSAKSRLHTYSTETKCYEGEVTTESRFVPESILHFVI